MEKNAALSLNNVSFQFSKTSPLFFRNLTVSFPAKQLHFIRGQNGAGKSTLLRILQGNIQRNEVATGTLSILNQDINLAQPQQSPVHIGFVPQRFDLMIADQFSFAENCRFAQLPHFPGLTPLPQATSIPELLKRFTIDMHCPAFLLSGGQRQILAIIMALQKQASLLLLDEPTATLDEDNASMVMQFLQDLVATQNITILIVCHDRALLQSYAHQYYYELTLNDATGERSIITVQHRQ